jgi:hypothetical protein
MRSILAGAPAVEAIPDDLATATRWFEESLARWSEIVCNLPPENSARFPQGYLALGYYLTGDLNQVGGNDLLDALRRAKIPHTGWPEFLVPTRPEIRPYPQNGTIECWIARDGQDHGAAHSDFWRASPEGKLFLIRGHQEDEGRVPGIAPSTVFDITLPTWRVGEALLHASNMAIEFGDPQARVNFVVELTGLAGRHLTHLERTRLIFDDHRTQQGRFRTSLTVQADQISDALPELVSQLVVPLYELFVFFRLPANLPAEELARMRANRF